MTRGSETVLSYGPSHPATGGAFRLRLVTDAEVIQSAEIEGGYAFSDAETALEGLHYVQIGAAIARLSDGNPIALQDAYARSVEQLAGVSVPERAVYLRTVLLELERLASHFGVLAEAAAYAGMTRAEQGCVEARHGVQRVFAMLTGNPLGHDLVRPGGLAFDFSPGQLVGVRAMLDALETATDVVCDSILEDGAFRSAYKGVGPVPLKLVTEHGVSGPVLRAAGGVADLRSDSPYLAYESVKFDVISASHGDAFDRYAVRAYECRESVALARQLIEQLPGGPLRVENHGMTPPARTAIHEATDLMAEHLHHYTQGFELAPGEGFAPGESPRGELGVLVVANGTTRPTRLEVRSPSTPLLAALPFALQGAHLSQVQPIAQSFDLAVGESER